MTYQVLARKWRPQDFSSLVGQEPIVTALRNATLENRIAQAYLFSGIRGVGKTTAARVFAKALNCERGPAADPCNECETCQQITSGNDIDFIEVDAATYSKVEQVRELVESLRYGPAQNRFKVAVLDEVHRLSRQAFDALLKIVEEPPPHLVFIFATTEIDAVPATILSRCQEFRFRRVPSDVLAEHLRRICEAEEISASDTALRLIARAGEGSVRDSVALLDQLANFGNGTIADEDAQNLLGGLDTAVFERILRAILAGDRAEISSVVREIEQNGWDPHGVFGQFLGYVRDALHLSTGAEGAAVDLPEGERKTLAEIARPAGFENLLRLGQLLLASEGSVRRSEFGILALEIAWLRAAELPKLTAIEEMLASERPGGGGGSGGPAGGGGGRPARGRGGAPPSAMAGPREKATKEEPPSRPAPAAANGSGIRLFLDTLSTRKPTLAAHFSSAPEPVYREGVLEIAVPEGDGLFERALARSSIRGFLDSLVREIWGDGTSWKIVAPAASTPSAAGDTEPEEPPAAAEAAPRAEPPRNPPDSRPVSGASRRQIRDDPTVQTVLEVFDGIIEDVREATPKENPT